MENLPELWNIIDKGGTLGLALAVLLSIIKQFLVPGWVHTNCMERNKLLEDLATKRADRLEAKQDEYEKRRWGDSNERP